MSWLFAQPFVQAQIQENIKAPRHLFLCGKSTGGRWIPRTKGQQRGKCFHLVTSSCKSDITNLAASGLHFELTCKIIPSRKCRLQTGGYDKAVHLTHSFRVYIELRLIGTVCYRVWRSVQLKNGAMPSAGIKLTTKRSIILKISFAVIHYEYKQCRWSVAIIQNGWINSVLYCSIQMHYSDATWPSWRLQLSANRLFVQQFAQADKKILKLRITDTFMRGIHRTSLSRHITQ